MIKKKKIINIILFSIVFLFLMTIKNINSGYAILEQNFSIYNDQAAKYITYLNDYNFFTLKDQIVIKKIINTKKIDYENEKMNLAMHHLLRNEKYLLNNNTNFCFMLNKIEFVFRDDDGGVSYYKFLYIKDNLITELKPAIGIKKYLFFFIYIFLFIFFYKKIIKIKTRELLH
jgi:hypothetical protein